MEDLREGIDIPAKEIKARPNDYDLGMYVRKLFNSSKTENQMQIQNETIKQAWEKTKQFLSTLSKVAIVVIALATGFAAGNLYYRYTTSLQSKEMQRTRTQAETSAAINERGEIMIVDRKSGRYDVYSDSVGQMIFDLYASRMYYSTTKK